MPKVTLRTKCLEFRLDGREMSATEEELDACPGSYLRIAIKFKFKLKALSADRCVATPERLNSRQM